MLWNAVGHRLIALAQRQAWFMTEPEREDIVQEAFPLFLALVEEWADTTVTGTGFLRYLFGMFRWRMRNLFRDERHGRAVTFSIGHTARGPEGDGDLAAFLTSLAPHERQILLLRANEGVSVQQIATRLGLTPRTVSRTWHRVLRRFEGFFAP
jgi:RNA polymerase sigma factor (sigma-70 family)